MNNTIRVLHILQRMEAGGTQALLMNIYRNIDRNRVQFDFLVEYPNEEFYDKEIKKMGGQIFYSNVRNDKNIFKFQQQLKELIRKYNYKIVHVHTYSIGYFVLKTAKKCGVPVRIAHSHSNNMTKNIKMPIKKIMQKLYLIHATDFFACSEEAGRYLFKNKNFIVLNNAIDSQKFIYNSEIEKKVRTELRLEKNFIVGHAGRFQPEKNHKFLIEVFKRIKKEKENAKLLLIGTGPLKKEIIQFIEKKGLDNDVIILSNRKDMNELFMAMNVFVFPSLYEGLGIVAIESQASGTPVIISDGVPDTAMITCICKKVSLNKSADEWAKEAINISDSNKKKRNMQREIIDSGFDLDATVSMIQKYYIEKEIEGNRV